MDSHLILTTRRGWNRRDLLLGAERIRAELRSPETDQNPMNLERLRSVADAIDLVVAVLDDSGDDFGSEALLQIARVTLRAAHNISAGRDAALIDALQDLAVPPHRDEWHWVGYLRISDQADHRFRSKAITDFGGSRSPVSVDADHWFRSMPITPFG